MTRLRSILASMAAATAFAACNEPAAQAPSQAAAGPLYMDVHDLGAGKVTADAVAKAHAADLSVQGRHGVQFLRYWVDEQQGKVYCLSRAPNPNAIVETHREAHGLLPSTVGLVSEGQ